MVENSRLNWTRPDRRHREPDPFADPLEGADWYGLGWTIPLVAALLSARRLPSERGHARLGLAVDKATDCSQPAKAVCVS